ncbi:hypothetical protein [Nocardioides sp.]|uniref:hypothetical protein n=1 Tax=Nocardioides sp. TaxID=35761 RepID=UPI00286B7991|nr:hypothetical protein [Nocardioides sp.]
MAKRGTFTTVSRAEAAAGDTAAMTSRAALEETQFAQAAGAKGSQPGPVAVHETTENPVVRQARTRKSKRVCAPSVPTSQERHQVLTDYRPTSLRWEDYRHFQKELVALVERMDFTSTSVDAAFLASSTAFLRWRLRVAAPESLAAVLTEANIQAYGMHLESQGATSATTMARLRHLRRGGPMPTGPIRKLVREPHTRAEALAFWESLARIAQERAFEGKVLWALTFGLGLTAQEVQAATADWVHVEGEKMFVVVHYDTGEFRVIPVVDAPVRQVLAQAARQARQAIVEQTAEKVRRSRKPISAEAWLLSPHIVVRRNLISVLKVALRRVHGLWATYDAARARGAWIAGLLESPMSFSMVCQIAGLNPGTKTPTELLRYLPEHKDVALHAAAQRLLGEPGRHLIILDLATRPGSGTVTEVN